VRESFAPVDYVGISLTAGILVSTDSYMNLQVGQQLGKRKLTAKNIPFCTAHKRR
jgi:hypothetical protein